MVSTTIKAVLMSTGVTVLALFLKASVPIALDFYLSRSPILRSSFLSWLTPPYLFLAINVIITILVATSSYHDVEEDEILHDEDYKIQGEPIVHRAPPQQLEVQYVDLEADFVATLTSPILITEVERSEVVYEEKEEEISGRLGNSGDELEVLTSSKLNQVPSMIDESENLSPAEKPLASARSDGHRIPVKASSKGGKKRKALRVAKPKKTLENTWKIITEEKSTPLTSQYRRSSDTIGPCAGEAQPALRKSVTFRDMTNYQKSPPVTPPMTMKKEMSPSREELNRRVEAFIKKCKEERLESMRFDKDLA